MPRRHDSVPHGWRVEHKTAELNGSRWLHHTQHLTECNINTFEKRRRDSVRNLRSAWNIQRIWETLNVESWWLCLCLCVSMCYTCVWNLQHRVEDTYTTYQWLKVHLPSELMLLLPTNLICVCVKGPLLVTRHPLLDDWETLMWRENSLTNKHTSVHSLCQTHTDLLMHLPTIHLHTFTHSCKFKHTYMCLATGLIVRFALFGE